MSSGFKPYFLDGSGPVPETENPLADPKPQPTLAENLAIGAYTASKNTVESNYDHRNFTKSSRVCCGNCKGDCKTDCC